MEQTDRSQRGGDRRGLEEISQKTYMHICIAHGHRQLSGKDWRMGLGGGGERGGNEIQL